jgi:hypothetical protein
LILGWRSLLFSQEWWGPIWYGVLGSLAVCHWREPVVFRFWIVTGDPWYPGYKTLIVAPEPFVERVTGAVHSTGGRIGTHMVLWVPSWDSVIGPWG